MGSRAPHSAVIYSRIGIPAPPRTFFALLSVRTHPVSFRQVVSEMSGKRQPTDGSIHWESAGRGVVAPADTLSRRSTLDKAGAETRGSTPRVGANQLPQSTWRARIGAVTIGSQSMTAPILLTSQSSHPKLSPPVTPIRREEIHRSPAQIQQSLPTRDSIIMTTRSEQAIRDRNVTVDWRDRHNVRALIPARCDRSNS